MTNGGYVIDTDALTISEVNGGSTNLLFTGVIDDQGGQADSFGPGGAVTNVGALGIPYIAVFTFDDLALDGTATFTVTGHRALALLSHGNAYINVALSLNGKIGVSAHIACAAPPGGAGGFAGGAASAINSQIALAEPGDGPGGGPGYSELDGPPRGAASGSFGSVGLMNSSNQTSVAYGDLTGVLQGGSGGGGTAILGVFPPSYSSGGGGGGALEIVAVGFLNIASAASLTADGANWVQIPTSFGGSGSGGGIRLAGRDLVVLGSVAADSQGWGGGGRIFLRGLDVRYRTDFGIGSVLPAGVSVKCLLDATAPNYFLLPSLTTITNRVLQGHVHIEMGTCDIPAGTSYELGLFVRSQAATTNQPAVDLLAVRDLAVEGTLTVPAGGFTNHNRIKLSGPLARITGADPLALAGPLSGEGSIEAPLAVLAGGSVAVGAGQELAFTQTVTNAPGGQINGINGILDFNGGLNNLGALNLINSTVNGNVTNNGTVSLAGTNTFTGIVSGAANFSGAGTARFSGAYSPGNSPAAVSFDGNVAFSPAATLHLELGGTQAATQYDQLKVRDTATFDGTLDVVLINGFVPAAGQVFHLFQVAHRTGSFTTVHLPALPAGLAWDNQIAANGSLAVMAAPGGSQAKPAVSR